MSRYSSPACAQKSSAPDSCRHTIPAARRLREIPGEQPDVIVIVPSATANEPAPELSADDRGMLENAGATSTQADAYVVNPATGQPTEVPLTPRRADGQVEYGPRRGYLLDQNVSRVGQLAPGGGRQRAV